MPHDFIPQPCEVCGEATKNRCSSCHKAGIDLFFCSPEHQKLVWPAHKCVCGPGKALPFAALPLSEAELAELHRRLDEVAVPGGSAPRTLRAELQPLGRKPAETVLQELPGPVSDTSRLLHKPLIVCLLRHVLARSFYSRAATTPPGDPRLQVRAGFLMVIVDGVHNPFAAAQMTAQFVHNILSWLRGFEVMPHNYAHATWFSLVQHTALIMSALFQYDLGGVTPDPSRPLFRGAHARFTEWVKAGMGTGNPHFVRALAGFNITMD